MSFQDFSRYTKGRFQIQDFDEEDRNYDADFEMLRSSSAPLLGQESSRNVSREELTRKSSPIVVDGGICRGEIPAAQNLPRRQSDSESSQRSLSSSGELSSSHKLTVVMPKLMREDDDLAAAAHHRSKIGAKPSIRRQLSSPMKLGRFEVTEVDHSSVYEKESLKSGDEIEYLTIGNYDPMLRSSSDDTDSRAASIRGSPHVSGDAIPSAQGGVPQNSFRKQPTGGPRVATNQEQSIGQLGVNEILEVLKSRMGNSDSECASLRQENAQLRSENEQLRKLCASLARSCGIDIASLLSEVPQKNQQNRW